MAKTIVIKNTSYSANKLDTVTFGESKPCTGITLTSDTLTFTTYGQIEEIGYTLIPEDTTDPVTITSGNTDIVEINNGNAIAYGVGSTTITIACGNQTATISVSSSMKMTNKNFKSGKYVVQSVSSGGEARTYAVENTLSSFGYCGTTEEWGDGRKAATSSEPYIPVARIPKNVASITVNVLSNSYKAVVAFFDSTQPGTQDLINNAYCLAGPMPSDVAFGTRTITVPTGADSFVVSYRQPSGEFVQSDYENQDVVFNAVSA